MANEVSATLFATAMSPVGAVVSAWMPATRPVVVSVGVGHIVEVEEPGGLVVITHGPGTEHRP